MSVEAHKCNVIDCKGFIVFENADFDYKNPPTVNGMYEFDDPKCTECGKEYKVVPHHAVIALDEHEDIELVESACITQFEKREQVRSFENEIMPYEKVKKFIQLRRYTYSPEEVIARYTNYKNGEYVSHTMKDCIKNLTPELERLAPF
ncbi:hypothetical protein [Jeotgalibacillus proteolyticus]|uniref:hypothetical protein n=1 Tax=Jeotgalibacillus proteolyticus TaxID=2082395 RepID=UPI001FD642C8|nr:hypothetical protein [Jeotgalibacillus proteolyticus]